MEPTDEMMAAAHSAYQSCGRVEEFGDFDEALREAVDAAVDAMPTHTQPVKLTLVGSEEMADDVEFEVGTYTQGVHVERFDDKAPITIYDTAGQPTKNAIARFFPNLGWLVEGDTTNAIYNRAHVQAVPARPLGMREVKLDSKPVHLAARIVGFRSHDDTPHDITSAIHAAAEVLGTTDIEVVVRPVLA